MNAGNLRSWSPQAQDGILAAVCVLVIGIYAAIARPGILETWSSQADGNFYNMLVDGFRAGQLHLKQEAPAGLAQLSDPYDPTANFAYQWRDHYPLGDTSYYNGKLYLYFGITPALLLFWPYKALTGHYLLHQQAVIIFCVTGFLAGAGLLHALWRRFFPEVSVGVVAAGALALGLASGVPVLLARSEIPISCGYMLTTLAMAAVWCSLHEPGRRRRWVAVASAAYGLAVGARPSLLFGSAMLLVPVAQAWRERRQLWTVLLAATGPIVLIGIGLMFYNALRFGNPFEFGQRYQLGEVRQITMQHFSVRHLWFNLRVYFLEPARCTIHFPFVHDLAAPLTPSSHGRFGLLANVPWVWLALAAPLAWRGRSARDCSNLRAFVAAVVLFYGICAMTLCLYFYEALRFRMELLPALAFLATVGVLGLERALADRQHWRRAARWAWGALLVVSISFNLLANFQQRAETHYNLGTIAAHLGRVEESIGHYEHALRISPADAQTHNNLGISLAQAGRLQEAITHFERALQIDPTIFEVYGNLGNALILAGKLPDAIAHWEQALQIKPDSAEVHYNLGLAFEQMGKTNDAIQHYELALKLQPDMIEAQENLARLRAGADLLEKRTPVPPVKD